VFSKNKFIAYSIKIWQGFWANTELFLLEKEEQHPITFANGKELTYHAQIKMALGADNYFSHHYH
jgi:IS30 family transposase